MMNGLTDTKMRNSYPRAFFEMSKIAKSALLSMVLILSAAETAQSQSILRDLFGYPSHNFGTRHQMISDVFDCFRRSVRLDAVAVRMNDRTPSIAIRQRVETFPRIFVEIARTESEMSAANNTRSTVSDLVSEVWVRVVDNREDFHEVIWIIQDGLRNPEDDNQHLSFYLLNSILDCSSRYFRSRS